MLDEKQIKCAALIASGMNYTDIAKELTIARGTIYNWLKLEEFRAELHNLEREFISVASKYFAAHAPKAAQNIVNLASNAKSEKIRLEASAYVADKATGKATTKVEVSDSSKGNGITTDVLEQELNEFDNE